MQMKWILSNHRLQQMVSVPDKSGSNFCLKIMLSVILIFLCYFNVIHEDVLHLQISKDG